MVDKIASDSPDRTASLLDQSHLYYYALRFGGRYFGGAASHVLEQVFCSTSNVGVIGNDFEKNTSPLNRNIDLEGR